MYFIYLLPYLDDLLLTADVDDKYYLLVVLLLMAYRIVSMIC